ncbi:MAG: hypothetical protein AWU59_1325 [Methanolobus sp. T82-4]|jgi:predicted transcriptional regulator|nr:MAG: hypothetical protein AWU59_1325 [Methanolobus sp. T82-4]
MLKPLQDVIFASEKRKNVLLLLNDGPQKMEVILNHLDTTRQGMLPQIRTLEKHKLVTGSNDTYRLTTIGKLIVDELLPLLNTLEVLDSDLNYWGNHNLDFVPAYLLKRLHELGTCSRIEVPFPEMFDEDEHFIEEAKRTKYIKNITTFLFPNFKKTFSELLENCVEISVIITEELYEKLMQENADDFDYLLHKPNISFYIYPEKYNFLSISLTDHAVMLRLLTDEGKYDNKRFICSSEDARKWGRDLFEYYRENSRRIERT